MKKIALTLWLFGFFMLGCGACMLAFTHQKSMLYFSGGFTLVSLAALLFVFDSRTIGRKPGKLSAIVSERSA